MAEQDDVCGLKFCPLPKGHEKGRCWDEVLLAEELRKARAKLAQALRVIEAADEIRRTIPGVMLLRFNTYDTERAKLKEMG